MPSRHFGIRVIGVIFLAAFSSACSSRSLGIGTGSPSTNSAGSVPTDGTTLTGSPTPSPGTGTQASTAPWTNGSNAQGGVTVDAGTKTVTANADGTLTSGVFDYNDPNFQYKTAVATSTRPYNVPLPDGRGSDAGAFLSGKLDMAALGNLGLYHLSADGAQIVDASGNAKNGTCTNCQLSTGRGLFDRSAMMFTGNTVAKFGKNTNAPIVSGQGAFTLTFWMNTNNPNGGPNGKGFIYGQRDVNDHLNGEWEIGMNVGAPDGDNAVPGQLHFWIWDSGPAEVQSVGGAAGAGWADGQWHQIVAVRDVVGGKNVMALYIDGQLNAINQNEPQKNPTALATCLGAECNGGGQGNYFTGMIQELGVFNTAWSATTVADSYLRGSPNFKFQIRGCSDPQCTTSTTFAGPDGTANTFFYPTSNDAGTSLAMANNGSTSYAGGRYFQFKVSARPFTYQNNGQATTPPFSLTNLIFKAQ